MSDPRKSYRVLVRYTIRHDRIFKSEMVPLNEYDSLAEVEQALRGMDLTKLAKNYELRKDDVLAGVRIEIFKKAERGERRVRVYALKTESENWF
jgi:hypothetical protein